MNYCQILKASKVKLEKRLAQIENNKWNQQWRIEEQVIRRELAKR